MLGPILPQIAAATGLTPGTPVHVGIHDSNASLLPHILGRPAPFSVVSTGTWVIAMGAGSAPVTLDPARDSLINVSATGAAVPSARFMGGREFELALPGARPEPSQADLAQVLESGALLLPALAPESGPFQGQAARWHGPEPATGTGARAAAVPFYLALRTGECLRLIGHRGPVIVEGPFSRNRAFLQMLAEVTQRPVTASGSDTGTSQGAALLAAPDAAPIFGSEVPVMPSDDAALQGYSVRWRALVAASA